MNRCGVGDKGDDFHFSLAGGNLRVVVANRQLKVVGHQAPCVDERGIFRTPDLGGKYLGSFFGLYGEADFGAAI